MQKKISNFFNKLPLKPQNSIKSNTINSSKDNKEPETSSKYDSFNLPKCHVDLEDIMLRGKFNNSKNIKIEKEVHSLIVLPSISKPPTTRHLKKEKAERKEHWKGKESNSDDSNDSSSDEDVENRSVSSLQSKTSDSSRDLEINQKKTDKNPKKFNIRPVKHEPEKEFIITLNNKENASNLQNISNIIVIDDSSDEDVTIINYNPNCLKNKNKSAKATKPTKKSNKLPIPIQRNIPLYRKHVYGSKKQFFICDYDGRKYTEKSRLYYHIFCHMQRIECKICRAKLKPNSVKEHLRDFHAEGRQFKCDKCSMTFKAKKDVSRHLKIHLKKFECKKCLRKFRMQYDLNKHIEQFHDNPRSFECDYCGMKFYEKVVLKRHLWIHAGITKVKHLKCQKCDLATHDKQQFARHLARHERINNIYIRVGNKFKCGKCLKLYKNIISFERHYRMKHRKSQYICNYCNKVYKLKVKFVDHVQKCCKIRSKF